ncbi:RNA polymerase sigma-70 factor [Parabacteroides sp. OttesenSCG-928-G07]|nr:RNA polymerase sigma-70 factor [Parabacteroides sp. OttesenSCG-928-G07]
MLSDILIVKKIKEGDIRAFEELFKLYYSPLSLYAASITGNMDTAEEIIQDLFYILWRDKERLQILYSLKSYLYKSVKNKSLQYLEHKNIENKYSEFILSGKQQAGNSPQDEVEYKELEKIINLTIRRLPDRRQRIFRMHRFEGFKYTEIAEQLSLSVKTVEAEMAKALNSLRKEIENYTRIA